MNEVLKKELEALKIEVDELKKQLRVNSENDERRHQEIKELQKQQHQDNMKWRKIGALGIFSTPATILITLVGYFFKQKQIQRTKDSEEVKTNINQLTELIKEVKK